MGNVESGGCFLTWVSSRLFSTSHVASRGPLTLSTPCLCWPHSYLCSEILVASGVEPSIKCSVSPYPALLSLPSEYAWMGCGPPVLSTGLSHHPLSPALYPSVFFQPRMVPFETWSPRGLNSSSSFLPWIEATVRCGSLPALPPSALSSSTPVQPHSVHGLLNLLLSPGTFTSVSTGLFCLGATFWVWPVPTRALHSLPAHAASFTVQPLAASGLLHVHLLIHSQSFSTAVHNRKDFVSCTLSLRHLEWCLVHFKYPLTLVFWMRE